jgi:predicted alpha/beta-hydrolase family hydrolase
MLAMRERLETLAPVVAFDYPYQRAGRRAPDRLPVLIDAHRAEFERVAARGPVVLIGKSMGSRIGCHVAALVETAKPKRARPRALVCFGYPLIGLNGSRRDQVLLELESPILFVQGTRDPLCPLAELDALRPQIRARNELFVVEGGDHSLAVTRSVLKQQGLSQKDVEARILGAVRTFVSA